MDLLIPSVIRQFVVFIIFAATMVLPQTMSRPAPLDDVGLSVPYSVDELMKIVDAHNLRRGNVTPPAADMEYMTWDEELAAAADGWAVKCTLEHGKPANSTLTRFGQNIWAGIGFSNHANWVLPQTLSPFRAWDNEERSFDYETNSCEKNEICGHYTQIVWASTTTVGCGRAFCRRTELLPFDRWIVVCNYKPGGNIRGRHPYLAGPSCTRCSSGNGQCYQNTCRPCSDHAGPCDCKLQCQNCGQLDHETCTCSCPKGWHGNECGKPCVNTHEYCGKSPGWPGRFACAFASYIPRYCPLMCGVCEAEDPEFICNESNSADDSLTTAETTTENISDFIITSTAVSDDDVTTDVTKSHYDVRTTSSPTMKPEFVGNTEKSMSTLHHEEVLKESDSQVGDLGSVSTTPSVATQHQLEHFDVEVNQKGRGVNFAGNTVNSKNSDRLRAVVRNASNDVLTEIEGITSHNDTHISEVADSSGVRRNEMETRPTIQASTAESVFRTSRRSNQTEILSPTEIFSINENEFTTLPTTNDETQITTQSIPLKSTVSPYLLNSHTSDRTENSETSGETTLDPHLKSSNLEVPERQTSVVEDTLHGTPAQIVSSFPVTVAHSPSTDMPPGELNVSEINSVNDTSVLQSSAASTPSGVMEKVSMLPSTARSHSQTATFNGSAKASVIESTSSAQNGSVVPAPAEERYGAFPKHICHETFTAVASTGRTIFLFQGKHLWRINASSEQVQSEKESVHSYFGLDGQKVTAALYRQSSAQWMIFTYIEVFIIQNNQLSHPRPLRRRIRLTDLGIPFGAVVDAALYDDERKKSYLFTNQWVWRYDGERNVPDDGYPRRIHREFPDVTQRARPSAAVMLNGTYYILYGQKFTKINKGTHRAEDQRGWNFFDEYFDCFH